MLKAQGVCSSSLPIRKRNYRALGVASVLLFAATPGCGPGKSELLRARAVTDLGCPEPDLVVANLYPYVENVSGCGKQDVYAWDGRQDRWVSLRERAAFEMACDKSAIQIAVLDTMTYGASGCDKRIVYKFVWLTGFVADTASGPPAAPVSSLTLAENRIP